jgi:hypothetical protein
LHSLEVTHFTLQRLDLPAQMCRLGFRHLGRIAIRGFDSHQVFIDAALDLLYPLGEFGLREVAVVRIDRLELAAIDGDDGLGEQVEPPTQQDELADSTCGCNTLETA